MNRDPSTMSTTTSSGGSAPTPPPAGPRVPPSRSASARSANGVLVTPEAVELEIPTASVGLRALAYIIDLVALVVVGALILWAGAGVLGSLGRITGAAEQLLWIILLLVAAMMIVFPMVMEVLTNGRSLGKMVAKLRVVTVEAAPIGWRHAAIRATVGLVELILTLGMVAFLVALMSPRGQRVGDMVAGTLVVRDTISKGDISPVWFRPVHGTEAFAARLDVTALDDADYSVIRAALLRRGLDPARHAEVCAVIARQVWPRISSGPLPTSMTPQAVLTAIAAAYQARHAPRTTQRATDWVWDHEGRWDPTGG